MVLLNSSEIISVVRRALSKIDPRLVDHGERVAYIARALYYESADRAKLDLSTLLLLCLLHDIGAYKTNEIDDMVRFETEKPFDHSLFGYLFIKYTTRLSDYSMALLYHHTSYAELKEHPGVYSRYAQIIHLADRADILLHSAKPDLSVLRAQAGSRFNPDDVDALFRAESRGGFRAQILSGAYRDELDELLGLLSISRDEIMDYLELLVYAIDFRSPYTVTHTADTTIMSVECGKLLGLGERELQALHLGAFLHDIGKIAIPHTILDKPGRLTEEEFEVVKRHIPEGYAILRGVVSDEICDIALRHHEKLNGSGYSLGLTGDVLSLPQRIVAVADIFSALSQRRPYKEPFPKEKVIRILREMRDESLLCPRVVDTVCDHYDWLFERMQESNDPVRALYRSLNNEYAQLAGAAARNAAGERL